MIIGVVGKANVGKSTFFKSATLADVEIANYPFATIKPNHGIGFVRIDCIDKTFNVQCNPREGFCKKGQRFIPVKMIDVAGLVPGAHEGKGLGNEFLNDLLPADALIHVIDASGGTNEKGESVQPGTRDPAQDITFLEHELDMWFLNIMKRGWEKFARTIHQEKLKVSAAIAKQLSGLKVTEDHVIEALTDLPENPQTWTEHHLFSVAQRLRKKTKPMIIAANKIDLPESKKNYERLRTTFPDYTIIPCSADSELALKEADKKDLIEYTPGDKTFTVTGKLNEQQQKAISFITEHVLKPYDSTGVQHILNTIVFSTIRYLCVYPGGLNKLADKDGNILPDCYLMKPGSTALDFAYRLHTDIGKNFIKAIDVKTKRVVGKDHPLTHKDVIEIVTKK